jgi:hypothetical protein
MLLLHVAVTLFSKKWFQLPLKLTYNYKPNNYFETLIYILDNVYKACSQLGDDLGKNFRTECLEYKQRTM